MFNPNTYKTRRNKLIKKLGKGLILISGNKESCMNYPSNTYKFRQDSTFLYFFGIDKPNLNGIIDCDNNTSYLVGNDLSMEDIIWEGNQPLMQQLAENVGCEASISTQKMEKLLQDNKSRLNILPPYRPENKIYLSKILSCPITRLSNYISTPLIQASVDIRSVKEEQEIALLDKQMEIAYKMHTTAMRMAQPGASEREIAGTIEGIALSFGAQVSFPIILSKNGQTLHNHSHNNILQKGDLMLVDAGCESVEHYCTDHTRTTPVGGEFTNQQKEIYDLVLAANNNSFAASKPGINYRDCHFIAAKTIAAGLIDLGLMKGNVDEAVAAGAHTLFFPHGLGHMLGLDVHDMEDYGEDFVGYNESIKRSPDFGTAYLRLGRKLEPGFVITNEPGCYFIPELIDMWKAENKLSQFINYSKVEKYKNFGGIRLEDDVLVTEQGARLLGERIPINTEEVEATVKGK